MYRKKATCTAGTFAPTNFGSTHINANNAEAVAAHNIAETI